MTRDQIYAVLMAVHEDTLLLPNVAIAEVLPRGSLQPAEGRAPAWLAGYCDWNSRRVPVVRFEAMNGGRGGDDPRRERLVVLNSVGRHLPSGHLALITHGYPHLVTLNRSAIRPVAAHDGDRDELLLTRVRIANQEALIPDLEQIEAEIAHAQLPG